MDKSSLQVLLGQGMSVEQIAKRFDKHPSTISYWMAKHGLSARGRDRHAARGGIGRDRLKELVEAGMTIGEVAAELQRSNGTVRYWMRQYGLRTHRRRGRRRSKVVREARQAGQLTVRLTCAHHGEADFYLEGRGSYRCKQCRLEAVVRRRRRVKAMLVAEAGGACAICGYDRHMGALTFHHLDPLQKRLEINAKGVALALATLRAEARKCVLLCANCHSEVEGGVTELPVQFSMQ